MALDDEESSDEEFELEPLLMLLSSELSFTSLLLRSDSLVPQIIDSEGLPCLLFFFFTILSRSLASTFLGLSF